eukprot:SAG22_NODE_1447_length_4404_cov_2.969338_2_plen_231_part_00
MGRGPGHVQPAHCRRALNTRTCNDCPRCSPVASSEQHLHEQHLRDRLRQQGRGAVQPGEEGQEGVVRVMPKAPPPVVAWPPASARLKYDFALPPIVRFDLPILKVSMGSGWHAGRLRRSGGRQPTNEAPLRPVDPSKCVHIWTSLLRCRRRRRRRYLRRRYMYLPAPDSRSLPTSGWAPRSRPERRAGGRAGRHIWPSANNAPLQSALYYVTPIPPQITPPLTPQTAHKI